MPLQLKKEANNYRQNLKTKNHQKVRCFFAIL